MNLSMTKSRRSAEGLALTLLASLLLTACAVGPTYAPPAATTVTAWQAPPPHNGDTASLAACWSSWNDMTLRVVIDAAQASNPTLAQAASRITHRASARRADDCRVEPPAQCHRKLGRQSRQQRQRIRITRRDDESKFDLASRIGA